MNYPSLFMIESAIHSRNFGYRELADAEIVYHANRPLSFVGNYAIVFKIIINQKAYGIKIWHRPGINLQVSYEAFSAFLEQHSELTQYFVKFKYLDDGLIIDEKKYPVLLMNWVEGMPLYRFLEGNINSRREMERILKDFRNMMSLFYSLEFAHGDLCPENILISDSGKIVLIDYDDIYLSSISKGKPDLLNGHLAFQPPCRSSNKFKNKKLDIFPELIINIGIEALLVDFRLWSEFHLSNGDDFFFDQFDFREIEYSKAYKKLKALKNPNVESLLASLAESCGVNAVENLTRFNYDSLSNNTVLNSRKIKKRIAKGELISVLQEILTSMNHEGEESLILSQLGRLISADKRRKSGEITYERFEIIENQIRVLVLSELDRLT